MVYRPKKQLKKLGDKQFSEDIKKYIKTSHTFYGTRVPELKILAKRLHEEHSLKDFYRVFNKFWKSGYNEERSLAIYTLELYKEEFDIDTWNFIKLKLNEIKSWDKLDSISMNIIGEILSRTEKIKEDIFKLAESSNIWFNRIAIMSTIPLIRKNLIDMAMQIIKMNINEKNKYIQEANGLVLKEVSMQKPALARKFILKNIHMPEISFNIATENMKELRKMREIKKLKINNFLGFKSIKNIFKK